MGGTLVPINDYLTGIDRFTSGEQADVKTASTNLADLQTGAGSLPNKLKEALNQKLSYNKDIINQQSETMQNYFAAPSAARAKYQDVWNPFEREKLVAQDRTMALKPYDTLTGVLDQRMGDVADITTAGVQGWQGMVDAASTQLSAAQSRLGTALQAYQIAGGQQSAADELALSVAQFNEANKQFEATMAMNKDQNAQEQANWEKEYGLSQYKATHTGNGNSDGNVAAPDQIDAYAQMFRSGKIDASNIPTGIRGQVLARAEDFNKEAKADQDVADKKNKDLEAQNALNSPYSKYVKPGLDLWWEGITQWPGELSKWLQSNKK